MIRASTGSRSTPALRLVAQGRPFDCGTRLASDSHSFAQDDTLLMSPVSLSFTLLLMSFDPLRMPSYWYPSELTFSP